MCALKLKTIQSKKCKVTTDSTHSKPVAPDLLKKDFSAVAPNQKWTSDITYVWMNKGWLYLAVLLDLFTSDCRVVDENRRMTQQLVCDAFTMALFRRGFPKTQSFILIVAVTNVHTIFSD